MQYEKLKAEQIEKLPFVDNAIIEGGTLKSVEFSFDRKHYLFSGWHGIDISHQKPDKIVEKFVVSGTIDEVEIKPVYFDDEYKAKLFADKDAGLAVTKTHFNETKGQPTDADPISDFDEVPF